SGSPEAVAALRRLLKDPERWARGAAAVALKRLGPLAAEAAEDLDALKDDPDAWVRDVAERAAKEVRKAR
ncbi:MAG: HEAT repeat domain-containing protein, partial [Elusimicrobia bacterium]|nr:HEAT repeat domain-containing protein [Elusimicrobiota bacterium]